MTSRIYEHNADVCNFPGMSGNYAHAHAIFTRRYFSLDQRLGTRLTTDMVSAMYNIQSTLYKAVGLCKGCKMLVSIGCLQCEHS